MCIDLLHISVDSAGVNDFACFWSCVADQIAKQCPDLHDPDELQIVARGLYQTLTPCEREEYAKAAIAVRKLWWQKQKESERANSPASCGMAHNVNAIVTQ